MLRPSQKALVLIITATLLGWSATGELEAEATGTGNVASVPAIDVEPGDPVQQRRVDEAQALFDAHRLVLPDLVIWFFDDEAECAGHLGIFRRSSHPWSIRVCSELEFVLVHELAHAFIALHLDETDHDKYIAAHCLPTWSDRNFDWDQRGVEHAAFAIQQNLMSPRRSGRLSEEWERRARAYERLTGRPSPMRAES